MVKNIKILIILFNFSMLQKNMVVALTTEVQKRKLYI